MSKALIACLFACAFASYASAQVIYLPVQYQFSTGTGDDHYLYGGLDARVHAIANRGQSYGYATNLHRFDGGNSFGQPSPLYDRTKIYTDCIPYQDASRFGWNEADVRNEAYSHAARYFRKADLLAAAIIQPDGTRVVPPAPVMTLITPARYSAATMPAHGAIIIIPKKMLDRPLKEFTSPPAAKVASAE
jgi:hypothetical protein